MASRHDQLCVAFRQILNDIDTFYDKVSKRLTLVQMVFYEKYFIHNRPIISATAFSAMARSHYVSLQQLSQNVKSACDSVNVVASAISPKRRLRRQELHGANTGTWFIPWGVQVIYLQQQQQKIKTARDRAVLYCPSKSELGYLPDWWKEEDTEDSVSQQLLAIEILATERRQIRVNLRQDPTPTFLRAFANWKHDPNCPDTIEKNIKKRLHDLRPTSGQTTSDAWEITRRLIRKRSALELSAFLRIYLTKLEEQVFLRIPWNPTQRKSWLTEWENRLFKANPKSNASRPDRWQHGTIIDVATAATFIQYFAKQFISPPYDQASGEIACILLLFIAHGHPPQNSPYGVETLVLGLYRDNVLSHQRVKIGKNTITISKGLYKLIMCLFGKGDGTRNGRLFTEIRNLKRLERALKTASEHILGTDELPVMPSAFLCFPHILANTRMSVAERQAGRRARKIADIIASRNNT